jgi:serine/threonine-protein kinase RsbW
MQIIKGMKCGVGKEFEIQGALHEALANAIVHGCRNDPSKKVEFCVSCDESRGLLIVVRDPGPGFDPASIPDPVTGQNVYSEHGRGIYLVNQLMDEVRFERGGTEIHMRKF